MKKGAFLTNTARAGLVEDVAVLRALEEGTLGGHTAENLLAALTRDRAK